MTAIVGDLTRSALTFQELVELVRSALAHLYDYAFLQNHPLALQLDGAVGFDGVTRAQRLRRLLLECIEKLRPEDSRHSEETRSYAILTYRCVDGLSMIEVADKLALSRRQLYREYQRGVDAIASLVAEALHLAPAVRAESASRVNGDDRMAAAREEVERLKESMMVEPVDVLAVARSVHALLAARVARSSLCFTIDEAPELPLCIADRAMLRQAFVSLFSYALDVLPANGALQLSFALRPGTIQLKAQARGPDESAALTPQPSHRLGVGLSVALQLIEAMGGSVAIDVTQNRWRCLANLPIAENRTVLIIDDNADLAALYQRFLAGHNVGVVSATSAKQALALAHEVRPLVIVLDLMLPHEDGWEILQQLRSNEDTATTPIIICSVLNEPELALAMGADDYITKPVNQETLVNALRRWLGTLHPAV